MRQRLRSGILALFLVVRVAASDAYALDSSPADVVAVDPFALYGEEVRFAVIRNGEPVGQHTVAFARDGGDLVVTSRLNIEIKILFVTAYRYSYESVGRWRGGQLLALTARVDDDGEKKETLVVREGGELNVTGPKGTFRTGIDTMPTTHWNPRQTSQERLINTLTGEIDKIAVVHRGAAEVDGGRGRILAQHFEYTGDLRLETWYGPEGHWVGMLFKAKDGSTIEYVCVDCLGAPGVAG